MTARRSHLGARSSDLLDGRLCAAEEAVVRQHLASCRDCAELVRAERSVRATLRGLGAPASAAAGPHPVTRPPIAPRAGLMDGLLAVPVALADPHPAHRQPALRQTAPRRTVHLPGTRRLSAAVLGTLALAAASTGAVGIATVAAPSPAPVNRVATATPQRPGVVLVGLGATDARPGASSRATSVGRASAAFRTLPLHVPAFVAVP